MIEFHNGHKFDFGCASGALAFHGEGWWFERPWRWIKELRPEEFTVIIKTLTFSPRKGNYVWWRPWTCVRLLERGGVVNAIGLTNPGYEWWLGEPYEYVTKKGYKVIVSIAPDTPIEAAVMAEAFNHVDVAGLQLNVSCPNVGHRDDVDYVCEMTNAVLKLTRHPLVVKLSYASSYTQICKELDGRVAAFELINSVPFGRVYKNRSPLLRYGYSGGVSGKPIAALSRLALKNVKAAGVQTPVISGGGVDSLREVRAREELGAAGFVFGSIFIRKPWLPNQIVRQHRRC